MAGPSLPADLDETSLTEAVLDSFSGAADDRLRQLLTALVSHLHAAIRESEPTIAEWEAAIAYLTDTGQTCTDTRQEFVLLSDVLGISSLVENINHRKSPAATEATVLGPFHLTESPPRELGASIDEVGVATPALVTGSVSSADGTPLPGTRLDIWQADDEGYYDVQRPDNQPPGNGRGLFTADERGQFWFSTIVPSHYPIPTDGPVGRLLAATGRHPFRPAHIHLIATVDGHIPVTTHIFVAGSPYLDSDAVFAVKHSLVREFEWVDDPARAAHHGLPNPYQHARIDLVLEPAASDPGAPA